jgi:hypothetical protein
MQTPRRRGKFLFQSSDLKARNHRDNGSGTNDRQFVGASVISIL